MVPTHPILTNDHASAWLGIAVDRADFDDVLIRMTVREDMVNGFGTERVEVDWTTSTSPPEKLSSLNSVDAAAPSPRHRR